MDAWKAELFEWTTHSWEEVLTPEERLGGPSLWGSSRWAAFKKCPYYYYCLYIEELRPTEIDEALEIGGLYHEARAHYHTGILSDLPVQECIQAGYDIINRAEKVVPSYASMVRRMYKGWLVHSGPGTPNDNSSVVQGSEVLLEYYDGPFPYSTRLDLWCWRDDEIEIIEIKTSARRSGQLLLSYRMDSQFLGQMWLWEKVMVPQGYPSLKNFTIDLAIKTDPPQYSRETSPISSWALADWEHEMIQHYRELCHYEKSVKNWPKRRSYHSCHWCKLFTYCSSNGTNRSGWTKNK